MWLHEYPRPQAAPRRLRHLLLREIFVAIANERDNVAVLDHVGAYVRVAHAAPHDCPAIAVCDAAVRLHYRIAIERPASDKAAQGVGSRQAAAVAAQRLASVADSGDLNQLSFGGTGEARVTRLAMFLILELLIPAIFACCYSASAMTFSIITMPDGHRIVAGVGEIVSGDAARLQVILQSADRDPWGNKSIALNSPGGSVAAAFEMVAVMDREKVSTIVPPGAKCASACAQVLFVSGIHRVVLEGGLLGMHSCSRAGIRSELCNEEIAMNAVAHGVAHGSVMAFMRYVGPSDILWFSSKDADCWGLAKWPPGMGYAPQPGELGPCVEAAIRQASRVPVPPRDHGAPTSEDMQLDKFLATKPAWCSNARRWVERYICADAFLAALDARLERAYFDALPKQPASTRSAFIATQGVWLKTWPQRCGLGPLGDQTPADVPRFRNCLFDAYAARLRQLGAALPPDQIVRKYL